ncbi:hypothetical protein [Synechococcus sp. BSF8S]|uniref:hypothetical protein n=1 Tax=Synechococcus sp. BSF8S TaxID=2599078 RepID=UPI001C890579|nr:hypothetical protein [Synechococcus sp. BSF8S]
MFRILLVFDDPQGLIQQGARLHAAEPHQAGVDQFQQQQSLGPCVGHGLDQQQALLQPLLP